LVQWYPKDIRQTLVGEFHDVILNQAYAVAGSLHQAPVNLFAVSKGVLGRFALRDIQPTADEADKIVFGIPKRLNFIY
jgi:hypothetical protein